MKHLRKILHLAASQHGVIGRHQLRTWLTPKQADDLLRTPHFTRLLRGAYRLRGAPELVEQFAFAAALRARPDAVVTGPLALRLYGVAGFHDAEDFEVLTPTWRRLADVPFPYRADLVERRGVRRYGQVQVAGPLDALIDAATFTATVEARRLRVGWDHVRGKGLATPDKLQRRVEEVRERVPGARILEQALEQGGGLRVESEGERKLAPILGCFVPAFEPQVWVTPGRRVDFFCRRCRYGYEYLGKVDHGYVAQRLADDERDAELRREGIRLGYVTHADLAEPVALLATVAGTLTVRAHELGVEPPVAVHPLPDALVDAR